MSLARKSHVITMKTEMGQELHICPCYCERKFLLKEVLILSLSKAPESIILENFGELTSQTHHHHHQTGDNPSE